MSSEGSEQTLRLLKELAVFKAMDEDYRAGPKGQAETEACGERERRRQEIKQEMQELAAESKGGPSQTSAVLCDCPPICTNRN